MKRLLLLISVIAVLLGSCTRRNADDLLKSVPLSSGYVALVSLRSLEKNEVAENALPSRFQLLFSPEAGLDSGAPMLIFEFKGATILSFYVKKGDGFKKYMEKNGVNFASLKGLQYATDNTVFISGNRVWMAPEYPEVHASDLLTLQGLATHESFMASPMAEKLLNSEDDITLCVDFNRLLGGSWNSDSRLALNIIFDDPAYGLGTINFDATEIIGEIKVLDSHGHPAHLALQLNPISPDGIKDFEGRGNVFAAVSPSSATIGALLSQLKGLPMIPSDLTATISRLEGDIICAAWVEPCGASLRSLSLMLTFSSDEAAADCARFVNSLSGGDGLSASATGAHCTVIYGEPSGEPFPEALMGSDSFLFFSALPAFFNCEAPGPFNDLASSCTLRLKEIDGEPVFTTEITLK